MKIRKKPKVTGYTQTYTMRNAQPLTMSDGEVKDLPEPLAMGLVQDYGEFLEAVTEATEEEQGDGN